MPFEPDAAPQAFGRFVPDDEQPKRRFEFDDEQTQPPKRDEFGGTILAKDEFGGYILPDKRGEAGAKASKRTWTQAAGDTAIDLAKGAVGLGESVIGVADLATGNLVGKGWGELGFDPARTKRILSEGYSDARQTANRKVANAEGFMDTTMALIDNPSTAVGSMVESAPMMLGGAAAVRGAATRMLAARGLVAGSAEAAGFLSNPAVVARLTAVGSAAEGAMTSGQIQEQGRQAGRDYTDTAPSALAGGALTAVIGAATSKIPGFRDAEVGAALAGMGGAQRQGLITAGKEIARGAFKEGLLEELPQSAQEQVFTNLALGKPWSENVAEAAAQGMIAGAGMGGGLNAYTSGRNALASTVAGPAAAPSPVDVPAAPPSEAAAPAAATAQPGAAMRPETRLVELDLLGQTRDLTAQEQGEFTALAQAMDQRTPSMDAQAPIFEDVPDFSQNQPLAPVEYAQAAINTVVNQDALQAANDPMIESGPQDQALAAGDLVSWPVNGKQVSGVVVSLPDAGESAVVRATSAEAGAGVRSGGVFNVPVVKLSTTQSTPAQAAPQPKLNWFGFLKEKGIAPASVKKDTPQWTNLKVEFEGRKAGVVASPAALVPSAVPSAVPSVAPASVPAVTPAMPTAALPGAMPVTPATNPSGQDLQNRDRSRAASVLQMVNIANNPDYMRLGASRTPDSGAPMVFPVGDDGWNIPEANLGRHDVAVMSDGQRVPFIYAVMDASQVEPSHFADGRVNPVFEFKVNGTIKALNNGRVAGLRAAHEQGTASNYVAELTNDAAIHGIPAEVIQRTPNPILVRAYQDASNTPNMAAKSQGQGLGMSPGELARQDAPLMDATVLTVYRPGDVASAANRDFVRAFFGKLVQTGQDVAGMMTAQGTLSPAGRTRIQAAMVQAAYGDADLVQEMFDSQDNDIKSIGEALKTMAGQWADMRDSARMGAIDAEVDITDNLVQAVNLIRKARQERTSLYDLVNQPDLMTGEAPDDLTRAMLRMFYGGQHLTTPFGREKVIGKLSEYTQAAMNSAHGADMFGQQVTVAQILATITQEGEPNGTATKPQDRNRSAAGSIDIGRAADDRGAQGPGQRDGEGRARPGEDSAGQRETGRGQIQAGSDQADQGSQTAAVNSETAFSRSTQGVKNGFKGWPKFKNWTRKEYEKVVSYLPAEYRNDPYRREPLPAADWDLHAGAAIPELDALNATVGEGTFRLDSLGNVLADARKNDASIFVDEAIKIADKHGLGIYITGVPTNSMARLRNAGFDTEMGLGAILQRATGSSQPPRPHADNIYSQPDYGTIMSYKPRGFAMAMFSRNGETEGDLLSSYDRTDSLEKQDTEEMALKQEQQQAPKPRQKKLTADQVDMFNPQESLFARRANIAKSLPVNQVQSVVEAIRTHWSNAPDVVVVASMEDSSIPKAVRDYDQKQRSLGASGSPEGFIYGGRVYVVADQLATHSDVIRVLFHEALGHLGMRGVFGAALNPILEQIILARRAEVAAKAKQYGLDMSKPEDALTAAEEVLAVMAQDKPELGFVKRSVAAIRTWLRANVPGFKDLELTDAEIINSFILPARAFVQQGQTLLTGEGQASAFSRNSLGNTPPTPLEPAQNNAWTVLKNRVMRLTSPENIDKLIYEFQDKHIDLKRVQAHIKELGGTITDLNDAYLGEELFHKRLAKRTEDFLADELKPLLAQMHADGVSLAEFETFLHARHAPEANAALAKRNPNRSELDVIKTRANADVKALELKMQHAKAAGSSTVAIATSLDDAKAEARKWFGAQAYQGTEDKRLSLSGMSNDAAAAHMASLTPRKREDLNELAARVDAINSETLDLLEKYGLMDRASINAWRNAYEFYVPLHRDEAQVESTSHPIGSGFSVKGNAAKQRTGSNEKVTHILGHIAMQREAALTRGEKNLVAKKLYLMAAQNPDEDVWTVDKPPMIKSIDQSTGIVRLGVDPLYKTRPNVLMVRVAGKDVAVVFNEDNPQALRLVGAMKNMDVGDLHVVLGLASKGTRWFASVNTQYNPIFGLVNFARDFSEGMINLSTTPISGKQLELAKGVPAAMRAVYRKERGKGAASAENANWIKLWGEMQDVGGATGYRDMYANAEDRVDALTKELQALDRGEVIQAAHAVVDWLSHYNETMENAVRLSAYKVALDAGMTKERAASLCKNLTVNFNRKGRQTREIGALYAFFNAAIQGTARMAETLKGPMGKRIMLGGVTLGMINGLVGMALMGGGGDGEDDEWDKIPEFIKENSLIIPLGRKDYLTIPMPLGFKVFPNIGRLAVEMALGGPDKTMGKAIGKMLSVLVDAFNPLGGTQNMGQMVAPTVIDPVVALMQNRDWTGRPIYRENNNPLSPQPGTKMVKNSASTAGKGLAKAINSITGGTEYRPGAWSPSPDALDYIFGQLTGGLGRELLKTNQLVTAPFTGDELPPYKIPLIGRLYGNTSGPAAQAEQFYENVKLLNEVENEMKGRARKGGDMQAYRDSEPLVALVGMGNGYEKMVSRLRKNRAMVVERAAPGYQGQVKEVDKQIGERMAEFNRQVAKARRQEMTK